MRRVLAILVALHCLGAGPAPRRFSYKILEKSGDVRAFLPWSARWRRVDKDQRLRFGTLVVVGDGASLVYERVDNLGKSDVLSIRTPLAFRIGEGDVRKLKIHPRFLERLPENLLGDLDPDKEMTMPLREAWERNVALLKASEENQRLMQQQAKKLGLEQKITLDMSSDSVKIITPKDQTYMVAQGMPHTMEIEWRGSGRTSPPYIVSVWKDAEKPRILATTDSESHRITFDQYGDYTVAVQGTLDGKSTPPDLIHITLRPPVDEPELAKKDAGSGSDAGKGSGEALSASGEERKTPLGAGPAKPVRLKLETPLPPSGFTAAVRSLPYELEFSWGEARPLAAGERYEWTLSDRKGKALQTLTGDVPFFQTRLAAAGAYTWSVKILKAGVKIALAETPERALTIVKADATTAPFGGQGILFLED